MTTRAALRATIRGELNDEGATALWPNARLDQWILEAIRDYSERLPREVTTTITSVANQEAYNLPADFDRVLRVEHPANHFRIHAPIASGDVLQDSSIPRIRVEEQLTYDVWASQLVLRPAPTAAGENIKLRYLAVYAEPAADADVLATPARDDELLVWYVGWRAFQWLSTDEAKRQRFERQRGASAAGEAQQYRELYEDGAAQRRQRVRPTRLAVRT